MHRPRLGTTAHPSHLRNRQIVSRPRALINNVPGSIGPAASSDRAPLQQTDPEPSPHLPLTGPHRITLAQDPRLRHRQEAPAVRPTPHASPPPGDSCPAQPNLSQGRPAQSGSPSWCQWNGMTWVAWSDIAPPLGRRSAIIFSPFILALVLASARMCRPHPTTKCLHHYGALSLLRGQETLWVNGSPRPSRTGRVTAGHMDLSADGSRHSLTSIV
jgi:hypothetical protein